MRKMIRIRRQRATKVSAEQKKGSLKTAFSNEIDYLIGAGNGIRTRDFNLGKVALYL